MQKQDAQTVSNPAARDGISGVKVFDGEDLCIFIASYRFRCW